MTQINWKMTPEDDAVVELIVERAAASAQAHGVTLDRLMLTMDVAACHLNGTPLELQRWLDADEFNFVHDVVGISRHMNRSTGKLDGRFLPRFAK